MKNSNRLYLLVIFVLVICLTAISINGYGIFLQAQDEGPTRNISHFPKNPEKYRPMAIPQHTDVKPTQSENIWVTYDMATGKETMHESPHLDLPNSITGSVKGGETAITGIDTDTAGVEYPVGGEYGSESDWPANFTDLTLVNSPELHPFRVNCKLYMSFASGNYVGSGVLIDPMHVLTAGHCVHDILHGGTWASSIVVVPAYENGIRHYGDASAVQLHSWTGWTVDGNWDHDMAVIDLDRPVGSLTGWHGYGFNNDSGFYTGNSFHNPGYPAESPYNGQWMYYWYGPFDYTESIFNIWYGNEVGINKVAYGGQSGSAAYYWDGGSGRWVYAVLSNGNSTSTWFPRILESKFYNIRDDFIASDTPATVDLIPLDVHTSPSSLPIGGALSSMDYLVHNYSSASWSGIVNVDVYLSSNDNISPSDILLQSHSFYWSFTEKSSVRVNVSSPPLIPSDLYAGNYYIGVVLSIADYDTSNNDSDGQDASPVRLYAVLPTVITNSVTLIGTTSAVCGGNVTSAGGASITARGVCWSTSMNPTTADSHTTDGSGLGSYVSNMTGLTPSTNYHVRAYATNGVGTAYGSDIPFSTVTPILPPTVETTAVTNIAQTTAQSGGNVASDGGAAVMERGVCWSTAVNPTTSDSNTSDGTGTGTYVSSLSGLSPNTTYHVRAYATNSVDTAYGNDIEFTTLQAGYWTTAKRLSWNPGYSGTPAIAIGASDMINMAWSDDSPGTYEIFYKKSTDGGATWSTGLRLTSDSHISKNPAIAVNSAGHINTVWYDNKPGNYEIYYRKSTNAGATWTTDKRLTFTSGASYEPKIVIDGSGRLHVVWYDTTPGNAEIYYTNSKDGGITWAAAKRLTSTSGSSRVPAIGVDSSGYLYVVWRDDTPGNSEIYYKKSTNGGTTWAANKRLTWNAGNSVVPAIGINASGHLHVVWQDDTPGNPQVFYKRSANGGVTWTANRRLSWVSNSAGAPDIVIDSDSHIHIVWEDSTPGNAGAYYRSSTDGGATWATAERLTWNSGTPPAAAFAADSSGNLHLVWQDNTSGNYEIYYMKYVKQ